MADVGSIENDAAAGVLNVEERFAIVPEWLLDADVSDAAIRLYAVLLRYGQPSGARMPGRATLARRLRKKSVDTIGGTMRELVIIGAVTVEHRYDGPRLLTNRYHLRARRPSSLSDDRTPVADGGRKNAAGVAAPVRHNPKHHHLPPTPQRDGQGGEPVAGGPSARWAHPSLVAALQTAVKARGWPAQHAAHALRIVAATPPPAHPCSSRRPDRGGTKPPPPSGRRSGAESENDKPEELGDSSVPLGRSRRNSLKSTGCASTCKPKPARNCAPNTNHSPGRPCSAEPISCVNGGGSSRRRPRHEPRDTSRHDQRRAGGDRRRRGASRRLVCALLRRAARTRRSQPRPETAGVDLAAHRRGFIIVASLAILHAVQRGRTERCPWALLVVFSALSVAFNVLHAPPIAIARLVAAVPPLMLVLSFELLMRQLRDRASSTAHPPAVDGSDIAHVQLPDSSQLPDDRLATTDAPVAVTAGDQSLLHCARAIHEQHRDARVRLTGKSLGQILGVSDGYAR